MLLGIKYISVFPKEVHTLPCGLTIYQSRLASHDDLYDACLGGPHSSFTVLAGKVGGTARLLTHFVDGLKLYKQWGPPKISCVSMTDEEIELARKCNADEGEMPEITELVRVEDAEADSELSSDEDDIFFCCKHCPSYTSVGVASEERVREFKKFQECLGNPYFPSKYLLFICIYEFY